MRKVADFCLVQGIIYTVQFLLLPFVVDIYPSDFEQVVNILLWSAFAVTVLAMALKKHPLAACVLSFPLYLVLVFLYHPQHLYGIGYGAFAVEWVQIPFLSLFVLGGEIVAWGAARLVYLIEGK